MKFRYRFVSFLIAQCLLGLVQMSVIGHFYLQRFLLALLTLLLQLLFVLFE